MDSLFSLLHSIQTGDYSVFELTPNEKASACRRLIDEALKGLRGEEDIYLSEYYLEKQAIQCAFNSNASCSCSHFHQILDRLCLIDNMYSTQMRMRPYGIGELAEALSLFGGDTQLKALYATFLADHDIAHFNFLKSRMSYYRGPSNTISDNLFTAGFGIEAHKKTTKKTWSLHTKYAYFLTGGNFPIYDSVVKEMIPLVWELTCPGVSLPKNYETIVDYIAAIDTLKTNLGGLSYDELDYILWHTGKIIRGNLSLVLSMEDYMLVPSGFDIKTVNLSTFSFLSKNKHLKSLFELAQFFSLCL